MEVMKFEVGKTYRLLKDVGPRKQGELLTFRREGYEIYYGVYHYEFLDEQGDVIDCELHDGVAEHVYIKNNLRAFFQKV